MDKETQKVMRSILNKHLNQVEAEGVTYEERRQQAARERMDNFVLSVGSLLHSVGLKFNYDGLVASKAAEKRLQKF